MDYSLACKKYLELQEQCEAIDRDAKQQKAGLQKLMSELEQWVTLKAQNEGLKTVPTPFGTAYWSTHVKCTTANPGAFRDYVINGNHFDLMETRPSKPAVTAHIKAYGEVPPGLNYGTVQVFVVRRPNEREE